MRRSAARVILLCAATLVAGCSPEASTTTRSGPAQADASPGLDSAEGGLGRAARKKREPGPSVAPRSSAVKSDPAL